MVKNYRHSEEFRAEFGKRLRNLRIEKGYTIEDAIKKLNVPRSTYSGWELGKRVPLSKSLSNIAELYETNVDYLMLKTNDPKRYNNNDLKKILEEGNINFVWKGKPLSETQASTIAAIIEAYLENEKK